MLSKPKGSVSGEGVLTGGVVGVSSPVVVSVSVSDGDGLWTTPPEGPAG